MEDWDDFSNHSAGSKSKNHYARTCLSKQSLEDKLLLIRKKQGQKVIASINSRADMVYRELKLRKDYNLSIQYVPAIISVNHKLQHAAYSKSMEDPGYFIAMEGVETKVENLILEFIKSGNFYLTIHLSAFVYL